MTTDERLYQRFLEGDEESLQKLIARYKRGLLRFIYGYVRDLGAAEDIFTDVFLALYENPTFQKQKGVKLKTYIYKVARNKAINFIKQRRRRGEIFFEDLANKEESRELYAYFVSKIGAPEHTLLQKEDKRKVWLALTRLRAEYREVLLLRYMDDCSPEEICAIVQLSQKQVYNLLARGKIAMRKLLQEEGIAK